jgi:signal transduction histidine kinase
MTSVALEAGCCDVLSAERATTDELVRALRLALEVARRQRAEAPWLEAPDDRSSWPPPALEEMRRLAGLGRTFVAVTHDLKNLLQPILGYAELLREPNEPDKAAEFAEEIVRLAEETDALLRRALVAAPGGRVAAAEPREGDQLLRGAERLLRSMVGGKVRLRLTCGAPGVCVTVPEGALSQILLNLAANARDSMLAGGLLEIRSRREAERWVIEVEDTGIGIPARDLGRVFEPGHSTKSGVVGAGLGLWIVRGLAEELGGRVRLSSRVGAGTLVTLALPAVAD